MKNKNLISLKKKIKNFKPSKISIAITSTLIGIGGTVLAQNIAKKDEPTKQYHLISPKEENIYHPPHFPKSRYFEDNFFDRSIFREMDLMREEIKRDFIEHKRRMNQFFHESSREITPQNSADITQKETQNEHIYELKFSGYKKEDIQISIQNQNLTIYAKNQKRKYNLHNTSNFYYSFYLPKYDQKTKPIITRSDNKITIIFKK